MFIQVGAQGHALDLVEQEQLALAEGGMIGADPAFTNGPGQPVLVGVDGFRNSWQRDKLAGLEIQFPGA